MTSRLLPLLPLALLLAACNGKPNAAAPSANAPGTALAAALRTAPAGVPQAIHLARAEAKPGQTLTLRGQIMGAKEPFVAGMAAFVLGDPAVLTPCNARPGDGCPTPWDVCCDSEADQRRGTALVQLVDASGAVAREPLEGLGGLAKLAFVTVEGTVAAASTPENLLLNATALRVGE
jgi:hypothetical protein